MVFIQGLLTAVFVVGCWYLLSKKKMSPIKVMLLLVVVAFIGVFVGFFNPGFILLNGEKR